MPIVKLPIALWLITNRGDTIKRAITGDVYSASQHSFCMVRWFITAIKVIIKQCSSKYLLTRFNYHSYTIEADKIKCEMHAINGMSEIQYRPKKRTPVRIPGFFQP